MRSLYTIAVEMTMANRVSPALEAIAQNLIGVHGHLTRATLAANRFRTALAAAGTALVAGGLLAGMAKIVDHGGEFLRITNQMKLQAWPKGLLDRAVGQSFALSRRYPSISAAEILTMTREMAPVLGDREEAIHITENMARLMRSLQMQFGAAHAGQFHKQIRDAVRAGELSANVLKHERFDHFINIMARSLNAFGGTLTPSDFMQAFKYSRAAGLNMSDRFVGEVLPTIMQELGASSAGTSFMTAFQAVIGGRMRLRSLNAFDELGLVDRTKVNPDNLTHEGRIRRMQPGLLVGSGLNMSDPDVWVQRFLIPSLIKKGHITQEGYNAVLAGDLRSPLGEATRKAITAQIALLYGDRTGQQLIDILALQVRKILRDSKLLREAYDLKRTEEVVFGDYVMAKLGIGKQWENLNAALALPNMESAITGLNVLSSGLGMLTDAVRGMNPSTVSAIFTGIGGFLVALVGGALVALVVTLGPVAAIVLGVAAAFGALAAAGTYAWHHRDEIKSMAMAGVQWFAQDFHWLTWPVILAKKAHGFIQQGMAALAERIGNGLRGVPAMVGDAIMAMVQGIAAKIRSAFASIGAWLGSFMPGGGGRPDSMPNVPGFRAIPPAGTPGGLQQQNWVPPARQQPSVVPIRHVLQIDGYKIGEAVSHYIAKAATHVQSAAQYDGGMGHVPVDLQFA